MPASIQRNTRLGARLALSLTLRLHAFPHFVDWPCFNFTQLRACAVSLRAVRRNAKLERSDVRRYIIIIINNNNIWKIADVSSMWGFAALAPIIQKSHIRNVLRNI